MVEEKSDRKKTNTVIFDVSKKEPFSINEGYKILHRRLKNSWRVGSNREQIRPEVLKTCDVFVLAGPRAMLLDTERQALKRFIEEGGRLLVMLGDGGEKRFQTNINVLLEVDSAQEKRNSQGLAFVYPYGATLNVSRNSIALLSTGTACFPLQRPVCALHQGPNSGRIVVLGSCHMLADLYIDKEENNKIQDIIMQLLTREDVKLNQIDARDPDITDYTTVPDIAYLADRPLGCLDESEELPSDYMNLFELNLFKLDNLALPTVLDSYEELQIKHEPLGLIRPHFDSPFPPLIPSVFPPQFRALKDPGLELFDLDEEFSSQMERLAQLTNRCTDDDLDYYILEAGEILGVFQNSSVKRQAAAVLDHIFTQVCEFKKLNQD
ncbi:intraflagellar transport protein 52 homolog isoform X2 [Varroa jacobsoni]|uniref:intraflagellar transport protein 52 homolog isoform X2 n=1 Tax=Varroa jacobsoni TaxID=62625 RepID=UPI000BF4A210|nr:intraflagellar transport protein 52 homolog isoform X2 [Varroa jacobsoni]